MSEVSVGTTCQVVFNPNGSTTYNYTNADGETWSKTRSAPVFKEDDSLPFFNVTDSDDSWNVWAKARNKVAQAVLNARSGNTKKKKEGKHTPPAESKK